jgi:hypothetical protein
MDNSRPDRISLPNMPILFLKTIISFLDIGQVIPFMLGKTPAYSTAYDSPPDPISLHNLPILVIKTIISYLDIGHVIPLMLVNKTLYSTLVTDNSFWLYLLRQRLDIKLPEEARGFNHLILLSHTRRCGHCLCMEGFPRIPYVNQFWRIPLCDRCRWHDDYRLMHATVAKEEYFLDEDDLLHLRVNSQDNPYCSTASYARQFSACAIRRRSEQKLLLQGITREQRLARKLDRSQREIYRQSVLRQTRRDDVIRCLDLIGFPNAHSHYCHAVDGFVRRTYRHPLRRNHRPDRPNRRRKRWELEDVVKWCSLRHLH